MPDPGPDDTFAGYLIEQQADDPSAEPIVLTALDPGSGRRVALIVHRGEAAERERFEVAWRSAEGLRHPSIPRVHRVGTEGEATFAAVESVEGSHLGAALATDGPMAPGAACALFGQVASAVEALHVAGFSHGSIDPSTVLIEARPGHDHAYLTGFGVAEGTTDGDLHDLGRLLVALVGDAEKPAGASSGPPSGAAARAAAVRAVGAGAAAGELERAADISAAAVEAVRSGTAPPGPTPAGPGTALDDSGAEDRAAAEPGDADASSRSRRRGVRLAFGLIAVAAIAAAVIVLATGGDDGDGGPEPVAGSTSAAPSAAASAGAEVDGKPIGVMGEPIGVAARDGVIYTVAREPGELVGFDERTRKRTFGPVEVGEGAEDLTIVKGVAWVTIPDEDRLVGLDLADEDGRLESAGVGEEPRSVVGAEGAIWTTDEGDGTLSRFDPDTGETEQLEIDADAPRGLYFALGSFWVTDASGVVLRVNSDDPGGARAYPVGNDPFGVLVSARSIWVSNSADGTVSRLDPDGTAVATIDVGGEPTGLAAEGETILVANADGYVSVIDVSTEVAQRVELPELGRNASPRAITVGESAWVSTKGGDELIGLKLGG